MIRLNIEAETAADLAAQLQGLLAMSAGATPVNEEQDKPSPEKPKRAPAKPKADPTPDAAPAAETGSEKTSAATSVEVDTTDKDSVKAYVNKAADVLGLNVIAEVFGELGATKFGDIGETKWNALVVRLTDLIEAKAAA
jgi:hypothetical protein